MIMKKAFHDITNISNKNIKLKIYKSSHRIKVLRWLFEVVRDFRYSQITYGLTIHILDTFTKENGLGLINYQLLGITALFISAKIEEIELKPVEDYISVTDNLITKKELLEMELKMFEFIKLPDLPHYFIKTWHLENMKTDLNLFIRREIIFNCFAFLFENMNDKLNGSVIYLQGIRLADEVVEGTPIQSSLMFYMQNNHITNKLYIF